MARTEVHRKAYILLCFDGISFYIRIRFLASCASSLIFLLTLSCSYAIMKDVLLQWIGIRIIYPGYVISMTLKKGSHCRKNN